MVLRRYRQVRSGEVVTSARAINEDTLKALYEFNLSILDVEFGPNPRKRKAEHPESWGGSAIRAMLGFAYVLSFLCLLRYDETLTLRWHWIKLETVDGRRRIKVSLPCRKTHQLGGEYLFIAMCSWAVLTGTGRNCPVLPLREPGKAVALPNTCVVKVGPVQQGTSGRLRVPQES